MEFSRTAFSVMGACAFGLTFVPLPLRSALDRCIRDLWEKLFSTADPFSYIEVSRKIKGINTNALWNSAAPGCNISIRNPFYEEVGVYLGSLNIEFETRHVCVYSLDHDHTHDDGPKFVFGLPLNETVADTYEGAQLSWKHIAVSTGKRSPGGDDEERSPGGDDEDVDNIFTLTMLKSDKPRLLLPYLHHISKVAHEIRRRHTLRTLYTNVRNRSHWIPVVFKHPSTFDTIALDGDLAERIQADLKAFSESEAYYHINGRAWKRGYLLYGPPGTGKSSLIAAIANFMQYDIYDLELTSVFDNSLLKTLLMETRPKSIIVIEDIDCSMSKAVSKCRQESNVFSHRRTTDSFDEVPETGSNRLTLSGLLNFADGLLSCFGEERIFIFTTNHKERLDSALLRSGRMDMHIVLSYCTFSAFKKLAFNYLGIQNHPFYGELEEALKPGVKITPADIAEILISERKDPDVAIMRVMAAIKTAELLDVSDQGHLRDATNAGDPLNNENKGLWKTHGENFERSVQELAQNKIQEMVASDENKVQETVASDGNGPFLTIQHGVDEQPFAEDKNRSEENFMNATNSLGNRTKRRRQKGVEQLIDDRAEKPKKLSRTSQAWKVGGLDRP